MLNSRNSKIFVTIIGLGSLLIASIYYLVMENTVREYRVTYSINSDSYDQYDSLPSIEITKGNSRVQLSPNYHSISDTVQQIGLRRFELRKYALGPKLEADYLDEQYFTKEAGLGLPERIKIYHLGDSKPLGKSVGLGLILLSLSMLALLVLRIRVRKHT